MATPKAERSPRRKKKPPKKFRLGYSLLVLLAMLCVGATAGIVAYSFGKQALEGVKPAPAGVKLPNPTPIANPNSSPKTSPKPSPSNQPTSSNSFLLDESQAIDAMKLRSQQELGGLTRPAFVAKANISDRKRIAAKVDRAYASMRDPLAISANADERIANRIAALRQRVYSSSQVYNRNFEQPIASNDSNASLTSAALSTPSTSMQMTPMVSRWQEQTEASPNQVTIEVLEIVPSSPNGSFFIAEPQPSRPIETNRR
ncbi:hypothetical protein [Pseudanabaena mucicola]|uniref:Uncharacterized protein n=1 Tax=Pseudanabaena mucicola FACHB-723 TaxID=2692860 RepID=A0ABR7ZXQ9_9CYAN|nr:hypothetical protein [Pseudanabaena mucicola]MBD2188771.1 hypothetical protein [Pseudanabaena mucicola FACHB-723]